MAVVSRNLSVTKSAYVKASSPYTHYGTNPSTAYLITGSHSANDANYLLFGLQSWPSSLKRNKLYCIRMRVYVRLADGSPIAYSIGDFNASTVTFANMPAVGPSVADFYTYPYTQEWTELFKPSDIDTSSTGRAANAHNLLNGKGFAVTRNWDATYESQKWYMKTALANGSAMYVEVTYDDTVKVTSQVRNVSGPSGTVNPRADQTFQWEYRPASTDRCYDENWTQASAVLHWKKSSEESYHSISISGSSLSCTVPAGTFPGGSTIQWYVSGTDTDGTTTNSSVLTFNTAAPSITITSCPSGNSYDTRKNSVFAWSFATSYGDYPQAQANLFWREAGGSWHTVSVTGDTMSITIPGNTFPTGKTVEWYMTVSSTDGYVATLALQSFATASSAIQATIYPSGRNVESGQPLNFAWVFRNSLGEYEQQSASLFWRASTSDPFQEIQASGSTRGLTVPKNTFPGNASTIYWYLSGTDAGGCSSETSVTSFRTVTSQITPQNSPTSGYRDPRNAITFSWYFKTPTASYDQASAVFHWRVSGASSWTNVAASGSTGSVTIAANTFPVASTIEWYISGTDTGGCSSESQVYSFSTAAGTAYAICKAPIGRVEDGTKEITFQWTVRNSDGSVPSKTVLQWKLPTESTWYTLLNTTQNVYSHTVAAYTFAAGPVEWRVWAYNRDNIAGPADTASFVVLRAPEPPIGVSASNVPLSTISWQSEGQEAYEITIDGEIVVSEYGPTVYSWQVPEPLKDGVHNILIRIQGSYGLWSNYAETSVLIQNSPSGTLTLEGIFGVDAALTVTMTDVPAGTELRPVEWYRDGKRIGQTMSREFTDRLAIGEHAYYAEVWLSDGNYTRSNIVEGDMETDSVVIAAISGGDWISIGLSEQSDNAQQFEWSQTTATHHITAADYPILEKSPYQDLVASYSCAFSNREDAVRFEQLRGKYVVVKSRGGQIVAGILNQFNKQVTTFHIVYTFSVQQIHMEDFIDDTDS